jgi:putative transposase
MITLLSALWDPAGMPRQARLDAPGALPHLRVRGMERRQLFGDARDRDAFLARLGRILQAAATPGYAWALLPTHAHLLLQTERVPVATVMRRLLTGYAGPCNRRHQLELVRYLHLNPVRAQVVPSLRALDRFPWTGHSVLGGTGPRAWQETAAILACQGSSNFPQVWSSKIPQPSPV